MMHYRGNEMDGTEPIRSNCPTSHSAQNRSEQLDENSDQDSASLDVSWSDCPLCREPIELIGIAPQQVVCPSCSLNCTLTPDVSEPDLEPIETVDETEQDSVETWLSHVPQPRNEPTARENLAAWNKSHPMLATVVACVVGLWLGLVVIAGVKYARMAADLHNKQDLLSQAIDGQDNFRRQAGKRLIGERKTSVKWKKDYVRVRRQLRLNEAAVMAYQARDLAATSPQDAVRMAASALKVASVQKGHPSAIAHQFLRTSLMGKDVQLLVGHSDRISALAISADGKWLASASADRTARLWPVGGGDVMDSHFILARHSGIVSTVAFTGAKHGLATGGHDATIRLWDTMAKNPAEGSRVLHNQAGRVGVLETSADKRWMVACGGDVRDGNLIRLWDLSYEHFVRFSMEVRVQDGNVQIAAFSPNGSWLVTGGQGSVVRLWPLESDFPLAQSIELKDHFGGVSAAVFTHDGRYLATGSAQSAGGEPTIRLWRLDKGSPHLESTLQGHWASVQAIASSPDSRWLASADDDGMVRVWDLTADKLISPKTTRKSTLLSTGGKPIRHLTISADSRWIVAAGADDKVRLWSLSGEGPDDTPVILGGHHGSVTAMTLAADGHTLATADEQNAIRLWSLDLARLSELALQQYESSSLADTVEQSIDAMATPLLSPTTATTKSINTLRVRLQAR